VPVRLFTDAERERLNQFPRDVPPGDLLASFTLSDADLDLIGDRRGDHNRLGYALQLKALPYLGFVPDDLASAPSRVVAYLALQLSVPSEALSRPAARARPATAVPSAAIPLAMCSCSPVITVPTGDLHGATADGSSTPVSSAPASSNRF